MSVGERRDVLVVGGGPAGLMAAETIAAVGHRVTVVDRMATLGRKLLMAGRGGLNLTHSEPLDAFLDRYGAERSRLDAAIRQFTPAELVAWAEGLGQSTFVGTSGRVFPRTMKASPLLRAWLHRLETAGVAFLPRHRLVKIDRMSATLERAEGQRVERTADAIVLATGGASWPRLGSDGSWVDILAALGVPMTPLLPANCGVSVSWSPTMLARAEGAALKRVAVRCGSAMARGEAIVTRNGLEGGAIYAVSRVARERLAKSGSALLEIDLKPDTDVDDLEERIAQARKGESRSNLLRKAVRLAPAAVALVAEAYASRWPATPTDLARAVKRVPVTVIGLAGIERAISTAGGVGWPAVDRHYMLIDVPGVFVAGEMLDWEAPTGGYLLQACFATGRAAGRGAIRWLDDQAAASGSKDQA